MYGQNHGRLGLPRQQSEPVGIAAGRKTQDLQRLRQRLLHARPQRGHPHRAPEGPRGEPEAKAHDETPPAGGRRQLQVQQPSYQCEKETRRRGRRKRNGIAPSQFGPPEDRTGGQEAAVQVRTGPTSSPSLLSSKKEKASTRKTT